MAQGETTNDVWPWVVLAGRGQRRVVGLFWLVGRENNKNKREQKKYLSMGLMVKKLLYTGDLMTMFEE